MNKSLVILFMCLYRALADRSEYSFASFTGLYPTSYLQLGQLKEDSRVIATMRCPQPMLDYGQIDLVIGPNLNNFQEIARSFDGDDIYTVVIDQILEDTGMYWLNIYTDYYYHVCTFKVEVDNVVILSATQTETYSQDTPFHKISVVNACKMRINYGGLPLEFIGIYDLNGIKGIIDDPAPIFRTANTSAIVSLPGPGDYFIGLNRSRIPDFFVPYSLTITTFCDSMCMAPGTIPPTCVTPTCGDGILDEGEQCDNGNKPGCDRCSISNGYTCVGNIGGSSICGKQAVCGDGVLDYGEECDNGNKPGCSSGCKIDAGYNCGSSSGSPSVCGFCGNGIVEPGEECDNKNQIGCSFGCKVDTGFSCRGLIVSACIRNNPLCGNGVWEVAESCDDGNKAQGDGCGPTCLVEPGYSCSGQPSKCTKKLTSCGNGIVEPENNEQCDSGNQQGCVGCVVQSGWECINLSGFPSKCSPKVVTPHCGNGILEPEKGEVCDDGNLVNGDGCSYFCKVEPEWICLDGKKCVKVNDANELKVLCGNGKLEGAEGCDDGNSVNGDGCSSGCKTEDGWECKSYSPLEKRSYCRRLINGDSFCGDGVIQGTEECDDGFPLVNGDGCNNRCRIEFGWTCQRIPNILISRCKII